MTHVNSDKKLIQMYDLSRSRVTCPIAGARPATHQHTHVHIRAPRLTNTRAITRNTTVSET